MYATLILIACFLSLPAGIWIGWQARGRIAIPDVPPFLDNQP